MLISVIVPIYNVEKYLKQCIDSIVSQSFKDYEVILVDDGSPDNCPVICDEYAKKYTQVKVIHKENGGLVSARKAGVKTAVGEYICFVDGDDWIKPDFLELIAEKITENNADILSFNFTRYTPERCEECIQPIILGYYLKNELIEKVYSHMLSTKPFYSFGIHPSVCAKCIRREIVLNEYKYIPDVVTLGEDTMLTCACLLEADSLEIINNTSYMYRQNMSSMTHSYNKNLMQGIVTLLEYIQDIGYKKSWDCSKQLEDYFVSLTGALIINELARHKCTLRESKKILSEYKMMPIIKELLQSVDLKKYPLKNKIVIECLKNNFYFLLMCITKLYVK